MCKGTIMHYMCCFCSNIIPIRNKYHVCVCVYRKIYKHINAYVCMCVCIIEYIARSRTAVGSARWYWELCLSSRSDSRCWQTRTHRRLQWLGGEGCRETPERLRVREIVKELKPEREKRYRNGRLQGEDIMGE